MFCKNNIVHILVWLLVTPWNALKRYSYNTAKQILNENIPYISEPVHCSISIQPIYTK